MKGTPFKTRRISPFMRAGQGLMGEALQEPEVTQNPEVVAEEPEVTQDANVLQEPIVAPQMQDTDPYKGKAELYSSELDYATTEYGGSSLEDINAVMKEGGVNPYDLNAEQVFDYSGKGMGDHSILGDDAEITDGHGWHMISKGLSNKVFPYGNIKRVKQDDDSYIETISVTAENHPLYGNTYTRTKTQNKERGTIKPIEDLNSVLSNYNYDYNEASGGILGITIKDGKANWHFTADSNFKEALEEGWYTNKDGSPLEDYEKAELRSEFNKAGNRFKGLEVTSTKLNKK